MRVPASKTWGGHFSPKPPWHAPCVDVIARKATERTSRAAKKVALSLRERKAVRAKDAVPLNRALGALGSLLAEREGYFL
jgi:hypothetical protein